MSLIGTRADQVPSNSDLGALARWSAPMLLGHISQILIAEDQKPSGINGGAPSAASAWLPRDLNTLVLCTIPGASLASNQITLPPGRYAVQASAPVYDAVHKARLYNVTAAAAVSTARGSSEFMPGHQSRSLIGGYVDLTTVSVLRIEHWVSSATGGGWGQPASTGEPEVYSRIVVRKVG